ncbi:hypothetical protein P0136_07810 [Lentisphaerota bacterium ZTH]|nr:hypothetical protein JYG24_01075 [Lentisphaerota bacterium]WET05270.1 hypothetical protein P0136_07810 [Lentisphaerota bacterium ZTH]
MLSAILQMIVGTVLSLKSFIMVIFRAGVWPDWQIIGLAFIFFAVWLGSGFLAATIAELRRHKVILHFFIGLIFPYVYPGILAVRLRTARSLELHDEEIRDVGESANLTSSLLNIKVRKEAERALRKGAEVPDNNELAFQASASIKLKHDATAQTSSEADGKVYNKRFFENFAVDSTGERSGPFEMCVNDGTRIEILKIKAVHNDLAVFEISTGKKTKSIRIKFQNIITFNKIN